MKTRKLIFEFRRAPGDVLMMTGAIRDLKQTYGDDVLIDVRTQFPAIWRHNPYITKLDRSARDVEFIALGGKKPDAADKQGLILAKAGSQGGPKVHYATVFHKVIAQKTGLRFPVRESRPDLHLSNEEKAKPFIAGRYWIIVPGGKTDMTTKWWYHHRYQEVVDRLRPWGLSFVQEGSTKDLHVHPPLTGVLNAVGQTSIRDMIVNIYHAEGVICGCTFQMHICGALEKPAVILFGGREEPWYEAYCDDYKAFGNTAKPTRVPHRVLHTYGLLDCCQRAACWLRRVEPLPDGNKQYNASLCSKPHRGTQQVVPECLHMIQTDHVVEAVMAYYEDGTLDPIGSPTGKYNQPPAAVKKSNKPLLADVIFGPPKTTDEPPPMPGLPFFLRETEEQQTGQAKTSPARVSIPPQTALAKVHTPIGRDHAALNVLDHPSISDRVTICVLLYGPEYELHRRCLNALTESVPPSRMDLRIYCNQVGVHTENLTKIMPATVVDFDYGRRLKFQTMRKAFHDPAHPIDTQWVVWFDDVAYARHGKWLSVLAETIIQQSADQNVGLLGVKQMHQLRAVGKDPRKWFQNADWWRGRQFRNKLGADAPNGDHIHYVSPNFFAIRADAIRECNVPDPRIGQSGGGITIGEQLHQHGFKAKHFDSDGKFVFCEQQSVKRGKREKYPWQ